MSLLCREYFECIHYPGSVENIEELLCSRWNPVFTPIGKAAGFRRTKFTYQLVSCATSSKEREDGTCFIVLGISRNEVTLYMVKLCLRFSLAHLCKSAVLIRFPSNIIRRHSFSHFILDLLSKLLSRERSPSTVIAIGSHSWVWPGKP